MEVESQRQPLLDVFRGFAIFGIFVVNITIMHSVLMYQDAYLTQFQDSVSEFITKLLQLFFYNKFFPIFSFLFGLGLTMQMKRKIASKTKHTAFFIRRMALLFLFGCAHIVFMWSGDVLHLYAVLGACSLLFIRFNSKVLVTMAVVLLVFPYYDAAAMWFARLFQPGLEQSLLHHGSDGLAEIIKTGSYVDTATARAEEYAANLPMLLFYLAPMALAMFLLGMAAGKSKVEFASTDWLKQFRTLALFTLAFTSIYRVSFLWLLPETELYNNELLRPIWFKLMFLSDVLFGLFYLWFIAWLWHELKLIKLLTPFRYVGKMALTNYLLQSLIGLFLFTGLGFSMYQTLTPAQCLLIAMTSFLLQALCSKYWLAYFQFGPLEWLWRCGSYMQIYPIRREVKEATLTDKVTS